MLHLKYRLYFAMPILKKKNADTDIGTSLPQAKILPPEILQLPSFALTPFLKHMFASLIYFCPIIIVCILVAA